MNIIYEVLNQIIIDNGWPTPQIARKKANRGGASQETIHNNPQF